MKFDQKVWNMCRKVPKGKVTTYKEIAHALGCCAYRAVGSALNRNPYAPEVPCHRVVGSSGHLQGFATGLQQKEKMLKEEGIKVKNMKVDLKKYMFRLSN